MAAQVIPAPDAAIARQSQSLATLALALTVTDNDSRVAAAEMGKTLAAMEKEIHAKVDPVVRKAMEAHREACKLRDEALEPITRAKRYLAGCIGGYDQQQERIRLAEQARLDREQREREAQEAARLRWEAEDRQLAEAQAALEIGDADLADAIVSAPTLVEMPPPAPVIVPSTVAPVAGVSGRGTWKFRVTSAALIPREYLAVDQVKIGGVVRAMKGATNIPGIEAYEDRSVNFRG